MPDCPAGRGGPSDEKRMPDSVVPPAGGERETLAGIEDAARESGRQIRHPSTGLP